MDFPQPWTERLRQRGKSSKPAETSTTVEQGSASRSNTSTKKNEAAARAGKKRRTAKPSGKPTNTGSRKRKANNHDNNYVHPDSEKERKRTCSSETLPPTPTSETRRSERLRTTQMPLDEHHVGILPSRAVLAETSLPTPSPIGTGFGHMAGSIATSTDLPNSVSPIKKASLILQSFLTTDVETSTLLTPPTSNEGNSQPPEALRVNVGENSTVERPSHSAPATTPSFEESSHRHTVEQSQPRRALEPAFECTSTRNSRDTRSIARGELPPVGYREPDNVVEAQGMERLETLADIAKEFTPSQTSEGDLDLHNIIPYLFLGSYIVILRD